MTRQQLSQAYFLRRELEMWEKELDELIQASQVKAQSLDGMPFQNTGDVSDKVADTAVKIIERTEMINSIRFAIECHLKDITAFMSTIDDAYLKQIIYYRCFRGMSWEAVARAIGYTTGDSCRMYYNRKIPKK